VHCGAGFPPSNTKPLEGEQIPLLEDSQTLEQLFVFIYPQPLPELNGDTVSFELLKKMAFAAEKYEMFVAMYMCKLRMKYVLYLSELAPLSPFRYVEIMYQLIP
jgi:hypothetical protein